MASKPGLQWPVSPDCSGQYGHDGSLAGRQVQREKLVGGRASRASGMATRARRKWFNSAERRNSNRGRDFGMRESTAGKASRAGRACRASR